MEIGIVGFASSGKTTIFNLLTGAGAATGGGKPDEAHIGVVKVPDERLHVLYEHFKVPKEVPVEMSVVDFAPFQRVEEKKKEMPPRLIAQMRTCDALIAVVRAFEDPAVVHPEGTVMPQRDMENLFLEFTLADLEVVERRLERIDESLKKGKKEERPALLREQPLMEHFKEILESGGILRDTALSAEEEAMIGGFGFLMRKPVMVVLNTGEEDIKNPPAYEFPEKLRKVPTVEMCGKIELELEGFAEGEKAEFMKEMGIDEAGRGRILRALAAVTDVVSFFTVGKNEVRAWLVRRGSNAVAAAGKVHTDMAKGFIRGEVVSFEDFQQYGGMHGVKEHGRFRLEGKEYIVQDGDIITFRFHV
ncbi:MAG: DUF933 domain-containing protein [bacterium]